ncbi:MAG: MAB_1171c family putative transporter [Sciscionella sp.]
MGVSALFLCTGLVAFLVTGYRGVLRARGRRKPSDLPWIVNGIAVGLAFIFLAPVVQDVESAITPSLGRLLSNVCTLIASFGALHLMLFVAYPTQQVPAKARTRLIALLLSLAAMTVMFFASHPPTGTGIFTGLYRTQPTLAAYTLIYSVYLGSTVGDLGQLALRSIRYTRAWLRLGMTLIALGCLLGAGYLIEKVIAVLNELITNSAPAESFCPSAFATIGCTFAVGMPALGVLAILFGATLPILGPRLERPPRRLAHRRAYRRLQPLWDTLHGARPDLALAAPELPATEKTPDISERLYRRVIAIRDGLLTLQPYRDPDDTRTHRHLAAISGIAQSRRPAAIEAADIRAALHRQHHGPPPSAGGPETAAAPQNDFPSEIRWLTQVSDALTRDEIHTTHHTGSAH